MGEDILGGSEDILGGFSETEAKVGKVTPPNNLPTGQWYVKLNEEGTHVTDLYLGQGNSTLHVAEFNGIPADGSVTASSLASSFLAELLPTTKVLTSKVGPISSKTELTDITGLGLGIGASATEIWRASWWLLVEAANATMDLKLGFSVPSSCTMKWGPLSGNPGNVAGWGAAPEATTPTAFLEAASTLTLGTRNGIIGVPITAIVYGGGTAGTVQPRFAQQTSNGENLSVILGSLLEARKVRN